MRTFPDSGVFYLNSVPSLPSTVTHGLLFIGSLLLSVVLTYLVRSLAQKYGWAMQAPRERDVHTRPIPRLGGVALALTFIGITGYVAWRYADLVSFFPQEVWGIDRNLLGILLGVALLLGVGVVDDIRGMAPWQKLLFHILAGVILAWSTVTIPHITNPFGGKLELGLLAPIFVVLWVVFIINAINWLDGLDGLASGVSLIAVLALYFLAIKPEVNQMSMAVLAIILAGALVGFLPFNFFPAKIFLGDSGSQVLGFLLAVFSIISGGKIATAFLVLGVPLLDVVWVIARRLLARKPIYAADRYHLHHRLLHVGLSQRQAVLLLYTLCAAFGIIALQTQSFGKFIALLVLLAIMVIGGIGLVLFTSYREKRKMSS